MAEQPLLRMSDLVARLRLSPKTIRALVRKGLVRSVQGVRVLLVTEAALQEFIDGAEGREQATATHPAVESRAGA